MKDTANNKRRHGKETVRINFEFPKKHYPYLKMVCAKNGVSLKDFATNLLIREIEETENIMLANKAQRRLNEMNEKDNIEFNDAAELAGWNDDKDI